MVTTARHHSFIMICFLFNGFAITKKTAPEFMQWALCTLAANSNSERCNDACELYSTRTRRSRVDCADVLGIESHVHVHAADRRCLADVLGG
eukprot:3919992-Prymnesium_polylepis.1